MNELGMGRKSNRKTLKVDAIAESNAKQTENESIENLVDLTNQIE